MYAELPAQTLHSMREWVEATEEMVTFFSFLSTQMFFPINMGRHIYSSAVENVFSMPRRKAVKV